MSTNAKRVLLSIFLIALSTAVVSLVPRQAIGADSGPTVTIVKPLPLPVTVVNLGGLQDANEPGRHPFQVRFVADASNEYRAALPAVPLGKRLVLQNISATVFGGGPRQVVLRVESPNNAGLAPLFAFPLTALPGSTPIHAVNAPFTGYIDGGGHAAIETNPAFVDQVLAGTLTGYIIDCSGPGVCDPM